MEDSQHARQRDKYDVTPMLPPRDTEWVENKRTAVHAQRGQAQALQVTRNIRDMHGL
jgi:hypothetical protein